jgi:hypothetical protein
MPVFNNYPLMINKIILLITLLSYSLIVSQSFMYILSLRKAQLGLSGSAYTELRQLLDANMRARFKWPTYIALLANLALIIVNLQGPSNLLFGTVVIAFTGLIIDVALTLKRSIPLNEIINKWSATNYPDNWKEIRQQWLEVFQKRQIVNIIGFVSLLIGVIFQD